ncbi:MAG: C2H2-type zinc finger protein [Planctomycetota bacterium]|jgi:hypothetical protein
MTLTCEDCGKEYKTRSGLWKHQQKCVADGNTKEGETRFGSPQPNEDNSSPPPPIQEEETEIVEEDDSDSIWNTWGQTEFEATPTETIPKELKLLSKGGNKRSKKKLTAKEQKALDEKSVALITTGLTLYDSGISLYGKKALQDPLYECRHSDKEKRMVSEATLEMLKDKDIEITNMLSPTTVAVALLGAYTVPPIYKIQKQTKRGIIKNGGKKLLSWIPVFGRRFRKPKNPTVDDILEEY